MKNLTLFLFLQSIIALSSSYADEFVTQNLITKGFRLPNDLVVKDYTLMSKILDESYLSAYIIKTNYRISKVEADTIATSIVRISKCFEIDPWVLTSLIQKESSFKRDAVSPTNASGLTQFTTSGFKEVNDQLGFRGKAAATEAAILYFNSQILSCVDTNWIDLWTKVGLPETDPEFYNTSKDLIKADIDLAVTYGAILLKTYVVYADLKNSKDPKDPKEDVPTPMSENYFQALQIYNGEEGDAKVKYAKNVFLNLKSLYPVPVNFSFLE
jgi:hypothetical protein